MRHIRLRIRLKRPTAPTGKGPVRHAKPAGDSLPGREFPPVPDGRAVPRPPVLPGELPHREVPALPASPPRRPVIRVSPAMAAGEPQIPTPDAGLIPRRSQAPFQPVLPSLGPPQADPSPPPAPPVAVSPKRTRDAAAVFVSSCPACGEALAERPHMKTVCSGCGKAIHVRGGQAIFPDGLVPDDEVDAVDLIERLEPLGITQDMCLQRLQRDENNRPRAGALAALLREMCEERLPELLPATQVRLLHEMARERQWRSEDPRPLLRRAQVILLQKMRTAGVSRVRMACSGSDACPACRELTGRSLSMEDALAQQMLPNADCRHPGGLCRCRYTEAENGAGSTGGPQSR